MELRHLQYFSAVAEQLSFRKAAQSLRASHSSICSQIMDLETEVGTSLLERNRHGVVLTDSGRTFLAGARRTLHCAEQTVETTRQTARGQAGELRIANIGLMCPSVLIKLIRAFLERFPEVQVSVVQHNDREWPEETLEQTQLGIGYLEGSQEHPVATPAEAGSLPPHQSASRLHRALERRFTES